MRSLFRGFLRRGKSTKPILVGVLPLCSPPTLATPVFALNGEFCVQNEQNGVVGGFVPIEIDGEALTPVVRTVACGVGKPMLYAGVLGDTVVVGDKHDVCARVRQHLGDNRPFTLLEIAELLGDPGLRDKALELCRSVLAVYGEKAAHDWYVNAGRSELSAESREANLAQEVDWSSETTVSSSQAVNSRKASRLTNELDFYVYALSRVFALAVLYFTLTTFVFPSLAYRSVAGRLTAPSRYTVAGAGVFMFEDEAGISSRRAQADDNGNFRFDSLQPARYEFLGLKIGEDAFLATTFLRDTRVADGASHEYLLTAYYAKKLGTMHFGTSGFILSKKEKEAVWGFLPPKLAERSVILCVGYADEVGDPSENFALGTRRAQYIGSAISEAESAKNAPIVIISFGEYGPKLESETAGELDYETRLALHRRVDVFEIPAASVNLLKPWTGGITRNKQRELRMVTEVAGLSRLR